MIFDNSICYDHNFFLSCYENETISNMSANVKAFIKSQSNSLYSL